MLVTTVCFYSSGRKFIQSLAQRMKLPMAAIAILPAAVLSLAPILTDAGSAVAQSRIGAATAIKNQVVSFRRGQSVRLGQGSSVFQSEAVSTGKASAARLTFLDETNLSIGPSSRVVLDEFVFSPSRSAQALTINLARGAFRFSTGKLDKRAYKIRTSTATIGVRGTVLDIFSQAGRTLVTLVDDGVAFLCQTGTSVCQTLSIRGATFLIDRAGVRRTTTRATRFTFNKYCTGNLCKRTRLAQRNDPPPPPGPPAVRSIVHQRDQSSALCNSGECTPTVVMTEQPENAEPTAGLLTGIAHLPGYTATWFRSELVVPSTVNAPLVNGDTVTATIKSQADAEITVSSSGPIVTKVTVDPGFKYTAWGEWNGNVSVSMYTGEVSSEPVKRGFVVFGNPTPPDVVLNKTGTATYSGPVLADFTPITAAGDFGPTQPGAVGGTINMTADFGKRLASGGMTLTKDGQAWAAPVFAGLPMGKNTAIGSRVVFSGQFANSSPTAEGSLEGSFLGPNAEEVAGHFQYLKQTGSASDGGVSGIFRGKQGAAQ